MAPRENPAAALLERVLASTVFRESNGHAELLQHVCYRTQAGEDLREHDIGVALFGLEPGYDVSENPMVANLMEETRAWLKAYFAGEGKREPLRLAVPKGEFRAFFYEASPEQLAAAEDEPSALERFWMAYLLNRQENLLIHGELPPEAVLIPEAYTAVKLALLFEKHTAHLRMVPYSAVGDELPPEANIILTGTPTSNPLLTRFVGAGLEGGVVVRTITEERQVITLLCAPQPEGILPVAELATSEPSLENALKKIGTDWPPHFRLTL